MAGKCSMEFCYPEEEGCNYEGCNVLSDCKHYHNGVAKDGKEASKQEGDDTEFFVRMPWTGSAMGLQDLNFLTSSSPVTLIGIAGVTSAGKTTFLATLYCLLRHGQKIGEYQFSGSLTLGGWENIAWYLSWKQNSVIHFPPHTSSNSGRIPGLLHISLRQPNGEKRDLVFTDAPGEWFDDWTTRVEGENAEGARWIHDNADALLLFADCEMLAGEDIGTARRQTRQVADRIKYKLESRPFGLVWAKSDFELEATVKEQISKYIQNSPIDNYREFEVSVRDVSGKNFHSNVLASIGWILEKTSLRPNVLPTLPKYLPEDMFLSKR
jgi:hypothetical protein